MNVKDVLEPTYEQLRAELMSAREVLTEYDKVVDALRARVAQLEAALKDIADREPWRGRKDYEAGDAGLADYWSDVAKQCHETARAALKDAPQ